MQHFFVSQSVVPDRDKSVLKRNFFASKLPCTRKRADFSPDAPDKAQIQSLRAKNGGK